MTQFDAAIPMLPCLMPGVRGALKFVSWKDRKASAASLKKIYRTDGRGRRAGVAHPYRDQRSEIRNTPLGQSRTRCWPSVISLFDGFEDIHKVIDTANAIESLIRMIREAVETERCFPQDRPSCRWPPATNAGAKWSNHLLSTLDRHTNSLCARVP